MQSRSGSLKLAVQMSGYKENVFFHIKVIDEESDIMLVKNCYYFHICAFFFSLKKILTKQSAP